MEIKVEQKGKVMVITPIGEIDARTVGEFTMILNQHLQAGQNRLIADLSGVNFMSSAGLRALLGTLKEARSSGGDFRLAAIQDNVRQVLDMTGFSGILKVFPTVDATVASFGG